MDRIQKNKTTIIVSFVLMTFLLPVSCSPPLKLEEADGITVMHLHLNSNWSLLSDLAWSPDGKFLSTTINVDMNELVTYIVNLDTQDLIAVQMDPSNNRQGASWSPDSSLLVLYYPFSDTRLDIVIVNANTGEIEQDVWNGDLAVWGNTQDEIIVIDDSIGRGGEELPIYLINTDNGQVDIVGNAIPGIASYHEVFDLSSRGDLIYPNQLGLVIMDLSSGKLIGSIESDYSIRSPSWSPSGEKIAYAEDVSENSEYRSSISLMTLDNLCQSSLGMEVYIKSLDWSPDGTKLAFVTNDAPGSIYFLDLTMGIGKEFLDAHNEKCTD